MTAHLSEENLVLHYYGESADSALAREHLRTCPDCDRAFQNVVRLLDACGGWDAPEPAPEYPAMLWSRLEPNLKRRWSFSRWISRPWVLAPALAGLLTATFLAGTYLEKRRHSDAAVATGIPGAARERILMVALGDHLERSQIVLAELVNTRWQGTSDISDEQRRALDLVSENRLYRQTASMGGETPLTDVLDDLERVLLDIAHSPSRISSPQLDAIRNRIESEGILFKIRVIDSNVRRNERDGGTPTNSKSEKL